MTRCERVETGKGGFEPPDLDVMAKCQLITKLEFQPITLPRERRAQCFGPEAGRNSQHHGIPARNKQRPGDIVTIAHALGPQLANAVANTVRIAVSANSIVAPMRRA